MKRVYKEIKSDLNLEGSTTPIKDGDIVVIKRMDKSKLVLKVVTGHCPYDCVFGPASLSCPFLHSVKRSMSGSDGKVIKTWRESRNNGLCLAKRMEEPDKSIVFKNIDEILENL